MDSLESPQKPKRNPCSALLLSEVNSRHRRIAVIGKVIECSEDEGKAMIEDGGVQAAISFSSSIQ
ncbi:MAG: hypothetical protein WC602_02300, partial [archaeon]